MEGNPINYADPTGLNPNCVPPARGGSVDFCARQRLDEINSQANNNAALVLVHIFEDDELTNMWGGTAGRTSASRLEWLLKVTRGLPNTSLPILPMHFNIGFGSDCGFREELRDSQLYPVWYSEDPNYPNEPQYDSNQVGHFLTAVSITYYHWDIGLIIGHEKVPDGNSADATLQDKFRNYFSYVSVTTQEHHMFRDAVTYDEQARYDQRDELLWAILNFDNNVGYGGVSPVRDGNSLQDFRLSVKGYRFAHWIQGNSNMHPSFAASWLRTNLMYQSSIPRPPR